MLQSCGTPCRRTQRTKIIFISSRGDWTSTWKEIHCKSLDKCQWIQKSLVPLPCSSPAPETSLPLNPATLWFLWAYGDSETKNGNSWEPIGALRRPGGGWDKVETRQWWLHGGMSMHSRYRAAGLPPLSCTTYLWWSWCLRHGMSEAAPHKLTGDFKTMV